jgi:hypothetical protein
MGPPWRGKGIQKCPVGWDLSRYQRDRATAMVFWAGHSRHQQMKLRVRAGGLAANLCSKALALFPREAGADLLCPEERGTPRFASKPKE